MINLKNNAAERCDNPLISVIVPAYNAEAWLGRCVGSVLGQTYRNLEVVIVDDGSRDGTGVLADSLSEMDGRTSVVHQENAGLSAARNAGIEVARGERIYFLDSDDYLDCDVLEKLSHCMSQTGAKMVAGGIKEVTGAGEVLGRTLVKPCVVDEHGFWSSFEDAFKNGTYNEYIVSCGKLCDRSLFSAERFDSRRIHEDEFIIHRLVAASGRVAFADCAGYNYVQTGGSISHTPTPGALLDSVEAFLLRCAYFESRGWWDFAMTAACLARDSLAACVDINGEIVRDGSFRDMRSRWLETCGRVAGKVQGRLRGKASCLVFAASPRLYAAMREATR